MANPNKDKVLQTPPATDSGSSPSSPSASAAAQDTKPSGQGAQAPCPSKASPADATAAPSDTVSAQVAASAKDGAAASAGQQEADVFVVDADEEGVCDEALISGEAEVREADVSPEELVLRAQAEREEWKDKFLRLHAEWDTYRRRTAEQRINEKAHATEKLVERLLPVIDDFERTIDYAEKNGETGLLGGVQAVHTKLIDALKKEGVIVLDPKGEAFDALECQAISTTDDKTVPDETVAEVYQRGYKMGKKVLRPAMVTVTTGGPKREISQEVEEI